ncbi:hypothetical protein Brsp01_49410 [Brucella sp. NBRC 12950]|nr:hypothetical protein Brsp01_49410 [Brucella sp. NBRC 12950]
MVRANIELNAAVKLLIVRLSKRLRCQAQLRDLVSRLFDEMIACWAQMLTKMLKRILGWQT